MLGSHGQLLIPSEAMSPAQKSLNSIYTVNLKFCIILELALCWLGSFPTAHCKDFLSHQLRPTVLRSHCIDIAYKLAISFF